MKLFLTFLPILILSVPAFADGFGANDKVLYFNSGVLIDVIKNTFPENLQLNVAQKYIDLMDENGNVSVNDLMSVCKTGALNTTKCRDFIQNLLQTDNTNIKPFYWADYISSGFDGDLNIYNSGDGYFHDNSALENGDWVIRFPWMKHKSDLYQKQYNGYNYLRGTSACTADAGIKYVTDETKNYVPNEQSGNHCWCRMTEPEVTAWVYYADKTDRIGGSCGRSCSLSCMASLRDEIEMRQSMFTAIKLNAGNARKTPDATLTGALTNEFKPCEFDWANDTNGKATWGGHKTQKPEWFHQPALWKLLEMEANNTRKRGANNAEDVAKHLEDTLKEYKNRPTESFHYAYNATGLNNEEWNMGGFEWMKSEHFQCKYSNVTKIKGVATCNSESGTYGKATNKLFKSNEATGFNCWCKMTYPEQSKWVYLDKFDTISGQTIKPQVFVKTTYTSSNGEIVKQEGDWENIQISKEEKNLELKADISYCDSVCLIGCSNKDEPMVKVMFESVGKK